MMFMRDDYSDLNMKKVEKLPYIFAGGLFARRYLIYCIQEVRFMDYSNVWLPLNRDYKPLGGDSKRTYNYDKCYGHFVKFKGDPRKRPEWFRRFDPTSDQLFLYNDDPESRVDYFERLGRMCMRMKEIHTIIRSEEHQKKCACWEGRHRALNERRKRQGLEPIVPLPAVSWCD